MSAMSAYSAFALMSLKLLMGFAMTMGECAEDVNLQAAKWWKHMDYIDDDAKVVISRWGYREVGDSIEAIKMRAARCIVSVQGSTEPTPSCQRLVDALELAGVYEKMKEQKQAREEKKRMKDRF